MGFSGYPMIPDGIIYNVYNPLNEGIWVLGFPKTDFAQHVFLYFPANPHIIRAKIRFKLSYLSD